MNLCLVYTTLFRLDCVRFSIDKRLSCSSFCLVIHLLGRHEQSFPRFTLCHETAYNFYTVNTSNLLFQWNMRVMAKDSCFHLVFTSFSNCLPSSYKTTDLPSKSLLSPQKYRVLILYTQLNVTYVSNVISPLHPQFVIR